MSGARSSGRDRALAHLRDTVLSDPEREGTFINEQLVAAAVGVSRTPVREALLILSSEGQVVMVPHRGAFLPPLSSRQIRELMDLRGVIERHAAALVLRPDTPPGAEPRPTPQRVVAAMEVLLEEQRAQSAAPDPASAPAFIRSDRAFHQAMVDAAGHLLLSRTYGTLRERQIRVGIRAMEAGTTRWAAVCEEHAGICETLRAGDLPAAQSAIETHLERTLQTLLAV